MLQTHNLLNYCCFTFTDTIGFLGTEAQDGHLDFHSFLYWWADFWTHTAKRAVG